MENFIYEYTMSVPQKQVISGAFDTLSHAMETYFGQSDENNASDDISEAVMKNTICNMRTLLTDINNYTARSNLMWDSAMAENGILKLGRKTAFQAHQIEHQLGAYTDCNHGQGLAVLHPVYYKHIYKDGLSKFARFAVNVWGISTEGKSDEELALAGIDALADFIKECGLPTHLTELNMKAELTDDVLKRIADSTNIIQTGYGVLTHEEIYNILKECIIGTFLESYDLSGKTVVPFCTSSSSKIDESMDLINRASKGAAVLEGMTANGSNDEIDVWLNKIGIK